MTEARLLLVPLVMAASGAFTSPALAASTGVAYDVVYGNAGHDVLIGNGGNGGPRGGRPGERDTIRADIDLIRGATAPV